MNVRLLGIALAAAVLSGCATGPRTVRSSITEFHSLGTPSAQASFAILPWGKELGESLEFQAYAKQAADVLRARGYNVVPQGSPAQYLVFLAYGIDSGRTEVSSYSIPQWGVTGYSGATTSGTINSVGRTTYLNAQTTATPTYGVTGYTQGTASTRIFRRFVNMDVVELEAGNPQPKKVYEGRLTSEGNCGNLAFVMPALISAMFARFPGESGKVRTENIVGQEGAC